MYLFEAFGMNYYDTEHITDISQTIEDRGKISNVEVLSKLERKLSQDENPREVLSKIENSFVSFIRGVSEQFPKWDNSDYNIDVNYEQMVDEDEPKYLALYLTKNTFLGAEYEVDSICEVETNIIDGYVMITNSMNLQILTEQDFDTLMHFVNRYHNECFNIDPKETKNYLQNYRDCSRDVYRAQLEREIIINRELFSKIKKRSIYTNNGEIKFLPAPKKEE